MCGRFTLDTTWAQVQAFLQPIPLRLPGPDPQPRFNIAPSQTCWTLRFDGDDLAAGPMHWGLLPPWARDLRAGYSTINARAETMRSKPAFRQAFEQRRCLVPASGYYEWKPAGRGKQACYVHPQRAPLLLFAGLWEPARSGLCEQPSFSIVTVPATESLQALHERMPLLIEGPDVRHWLQGSADAAERLAEGPPAVALQWHPVDAAVGNVRNQGQRLCHPLPDAHLNDLFSAHKPNAS